MDCGWHPHATRDISGTRTKHHCYHVNAFISNQRVKLRQSEEIAHSKRQTKEATEKILHTHPPLHWCVMLGGDLGEHSLRELDERKDLTKG